MSGTIRFLSFTLEALVFWEVVTAAARLSHAVSGLMLRCLLKKSFRYKEKWKRLHLQKQAQIKIKFGDSYESYLK